MKTIAIFRLAISSLLLASLLLATTRAAAIVSGQPSPGTSFESARSLGLTGSNTSGSSGVKLQTNDDLGYYFYLYPDKDTSASFTFYTYQPVINIESNSKTRLTLISLYDENRKLVSNGSSTNRCAASSSSPSRQACTASLSLSLKRNQKYTLWVNFHTFDDSYEGKLDASSYTGWLTWNATSISGSTSSQAWTWYDKSALYGQIDANQSEHWYKMNLSSGMKVEISLWGDNGSNLDVYVYRGDNSQLLGSAKSSSTYPEKVTVTVPTSSSTAKLLVKVTNTGKKSSEYYISYQRK